ncbi:MAG: selenocysteine-specific translation elongation factor [Myxococcota bacterium]
MTTRLILGTAGHIDHGKTALVRALTGVDCDRLPEERERGITIELGFAPLVLSSGAALGIVDVPGHERLVRTMVAGATGIDLVLFVVAADEGMMPQSREHLAICDLLGVQRGVVALTKIDAAIPDLVELARLEVEEELAVSCLSGAPIVPVSALRGDGIDELVWRLDEVARTALPRTPRDGPAWLAVDRVFSMKGFGTVVTGTLRGASLCEGEAVEILPESAGKSLATRIRTLQVHGERVERAQPGSRCALNLQGVELADVPRGSVVATPGRLAHRPRIEVELRLLPNALPLRGGTELTVHIGTCERNARLVLLECDRIEPGGCALAELRFQRPAVAVEGDRFIVRGFRRIPEAGWTLGGGRILDAAPLRSRRSRAERAAEARMLASADRGRALAARLERAKLRGVREIDLLREVTSLEGIVGIRVGGDRWLGVAAFEDLIERCTRAIAQDHSERPSEPWVGLAAVASRLPRHVPRDAIRAALEEGSKRRLIEEGPSGHRLPGHAAHVRDPALARRVADRLESAGLAPPTLEALAMELGISTRELRPVIEHLEREGRLVRVTAVLYFSRKEIDELRARVLSYLRGHGRIDPATYKELTGQTRKYTVPLMEHFDAEKLTRREGNVRVLRAGAS